MLAPIFGFQGRAEYFEGFDELFGVGNDLSGRVQNHREVNTLAADPNLNDGKAKTGPDSVRLGLLIKKPGYPGQGQGLQVPVNGSLADFQFTGKGLGIPATRATDAPEDPNQSAETLTLPESSFGIRSFFGHEPRPHSGRCTLWNQQ